MCEFECICSSVFVCVCVCAYMHMVGYYVCVHVFIVVFTIIYYKEQINNAK